MKVQKTKKYEIFKFRDDNRKKIDQSHVSRLIKSIDNNNLLEDNPIKVNANMEVMDGQHRLLAAKEMGIEIFYSVDKYGKEDIIRMNISKPWYAEDYLNYYVTNGNEEYIKLDNFMKENKIALNIALKLTMPNTVFSRDEFKEGLYTFDLEANFDQLRICKETIKYIRKMNGTSTYTQAGKFWKCLIKLAKSAHFDEKQWMHNLERMVNRIGPRVCEKDYMELFTEIHNWKRKNQIKLEDVT